MKPFMRPFGLLAWFSRLRPSASTLAIALLLQASANGAPTSRRELAPLAASKTALVPFEYSPFPYYGEVPGKRQPFFDVLDGKRRGHHSARAEATYWEDETYSDRRVLLHLPKNFDPRRPALIIVFLHGNEATLSRDVRQRQQVPRQVAQSGLNAALVAPQLAVSALDSSAGRFWEPGEFARFMAEAGDRLTELYGNERARGAFNTAPIVLVAYSGGYHPAAYILQRGRVDERLRGVILLDAPYGDHDKFADWLAQRPPAFFLSAFGKAAREDNTALQRLLAHRGVRFRTTLPARLSNGTVAFVAADDDVEHADFVSDALFGDPLKLVLRRVAGFSRAGGRPAAATPNRK